MYWPIIRNKYDPVGQVVQLVVAARVLDLELVENVEDVGVGRKQLVLAEKCLTFFGGVWVDPDIAVSMNTYSVFDLKKLVDTLYGSGFLLRKW